MVGSLSIFSLQQCFPVPTGLLVVASPAHVRSSDRELYVYPHHYTLLESILQSSRRSWGFLLLTPGFARLDTCT